MIQHYLHIYKDKANERYEVNTYKDDEYWSLNYPNITIKESQIEYYYEKYKNYNEINCFLQGKNKPSIIIKYYDQDNKILKEEKEEKVWLHNHEEYYSYEEYLIQTVL